MGRLVSNYSVFINAEPIAVYDYLADFSKHGEWSEGLSMEGASEGPAEVGSEFQSTGQMMGKEISNDIKVVESQRPSRLAFTATDGKAEFLQEISLSESGGGTRVERKVSFNANPFMSIGFKLLIGPMFANPSMNKSLNNLKAKIEEV